ncbi:MAG TPA: DmsE family decaheme c-type cytochrome [Terriglobales bacterium]
MKRTTALKLLVLPSVLWLMAGISGTRADPGPSAAKKSDSHARQAALPADPSLYVGAETCKTCHEEMFKSFETTPHWKTTLGKRGPEWQGCEACHGPGKEHVEGGGDKSKIFRFKDVTAEEVSERCLGCHEYGEEHANFSRSQHNTNDVSCIACHSPHHAREAQFLLVNKQPDLCFGCHTDVKQDFNRPFRHRVEQGLVRCTDCHNQHGGFLTKQLRATAAQDQVCFKCHTDKAGPFVFEHQPVKTEGCVACHTPHGSTNPRLLKRSQMNLLCLECHTLTQGAGDSGAPGLPSFHNQSQKYQACTVCHVAIHGSNFDATFFK